MQSYVIHLIRHGLTQGNFDGKYIGSTDLPLCEKGRKMLYAQKDSHPYPEAEVLYTSPLKRCLETAEILYPELNPQVVTDFRETDFGSWENKTGAEIAAEDPAFAAWMQGGKAVTPPGGENPGWFMQRTCLAFEHLVDGMMKQEVRTAAVVLHGGSIMSILSTYGLPRAKFYDWMTEPGCGYSLRVTPGLWMRSMVAEVFETIPPRAKQTEEEKKEYMVLDAAREAADKAFGDKENKKAKNEKTK